MQCLSFFQQVDQNEQIQKNLTWTNILAIAQKEVFSKLILNIQNKLHKLHNHYSSTPDEIKIKREMLPEYQLKIADFAIGNIAIGIAIAINISIGNIKN